MSLSIRALSTRRGRDRKSIFAERLEHSPIAVGAGGLLESASLWTGIRFLLVIAALLYLASWIALRLEGRLGEIPVSREQETFASAQAERCQ